MTEKMSPLLEDRIRWSMMFNRCMVCGLCQQQLEIHEIERRSAAPKRWADECNYLATCRQCHSSILVTEPHARQLARKLLHDPEHYDLNRWLRLRDPDLKAPRRVTQDEVEIQLQGLR